MQVTYDTKKIFIIFLALVSFITLFFLYMGHFHHLFVLETIVKEERKIATTVYRNTFKNINEKYELIAQNILMNEQVLDAFEKGDRERLLALTAPIYKELSLDNPDLKVMHFETADTRSFLRLHKPEKFGDDLSAFRHMINDVNRLQRKQIGMEVGRYGIYYRVALPVFSKAGKHLGAFEFGIDINYILNLFNNDYGFNSLIALKKGVFDIMTEANRELSSRPLNGEYHLLGRALATSCNCYGSEIITKPYVLERHNGRSDLIFKVTELKSAAGDAIGKLIFVKDLGFYLDEISLIRNSTVAAAVLLLVFTFYLMRRMFKNHTGVIRRYQSVLLQKNRTLKRLTNTDHLTKAYNRRHCDTLLRKEIKRANRYGEPLSILLIDVDDFKGVNDRHGHNVGDKILRGVAALIAASIRESDHFGRWGGEEFIIIAAQTDVGQAAALAEKLRRQIAAYQFETVGSVSCSFGVAGLGEGEGSEILVNNADTSLYEAKNSGKNRVVVHTPKA